MANEFYNVPVEATLEVIGGKWKVVIFLFVEGRDEAIQRAATFHAEDHEKMLAQQLRELEEEGLVHRRVYQQIPPKVEYSLTEEGESLRGILNQMCAWGTARIAARAQQK